MWASIANYIPEKAYNKNFETIHLKNVTKIIRAEYQINFGPNPNIKIKKTFGKNGAKILKIPNVGV